jgi:DNA-binding CsgD family transcriptional regulator
MGHLSSEMGQQQQNQQKSDNIQWRRSKVLELNSQGRDQREIASILHIGKSTVNRDLIYLKEKARDNIKRYIDERLPQEYEKCLVGLTSILREAWDTAIGSSEKREKIQALSLAKECYAMKLDLLTNATVVEDAIKFVASHAVPTEKANSDERVTVDEEISNSNDIQGSEKNRSWQSTTTGHTTTNSIF